ncbi:hypothetical protein [Paractinoplanes hotanensis]|uniref:Rhodanese domain-containing protein n=1 Tax=Paractinoplanes hotanensis TaxID=2906497 RepID=A0ABT0YCD1_9ACTN|nr:hypothetical protein [Actinoplanes hotanensis]MCM4083148.1 hypothetical protein [Actinoplanes hotanensis]
MIDSLGSYPAYFDRLGELNRHGRLVTTAPLLTPLDVAAVRRLLGDDAIAVDVRPIRDYSAGTSPARSPSRCAPSTPPGSAG